MTVFNFAGFKIHTAEADVGREVTSRTLMITCHGIATGGTFKNTHPGVLQFLAPKGTAFAGWTADVFKGEITPSDLNLTASNTYPDYDLSYFEGDTDAYIRRILLQYPKVPIDVMTFDQGASFGSGGGDATRLSTVMTFLKMRKMLYPAVWCKFCRVYSDQYNHGAGQWEAQTYLGKKTTSVSQMNNHRVNATALALEFQARGNK